TSGLVYVADYAAANSRIQRFDSTGGWQRAWGQNANGGGVFEVCTVASMCQGGAGSLGGGMINPQWVAVDTSGNVYVADNANDRIQRFGSSGAWARAWGKNVNGGGVFGVCTVATGCQAGSAGTLGGELDSPTGVATDQSGNVYVADVQNGRIQKFDASGAFLRAWGRNANGGGVFEMCTVASTCQAGNGVDLGGEMLFPAGLATDAAGNVYVADSGNNRIQKFDSSGTWERAWGKNVNGGGAFGVCTVA